MLKIVLTLMLLCALGAEIRRHPRRQRLSLLLRR